MKTTPKQYAQALLAATEGKDEREANAIIARFAERLRRDGRIGALPAIIGAFSALWNKAHGIVEAELISREVLDESALEAIRLFIGERYGAKHVVVVNTIDTMITGGIVIRVGDELLDGSIAAQLKKLKKHLTGTAVTHV